MASSFWGFYNKVSFYDFKFFDFVFELGSDGLHSVDAALISFNNGFDLVNGVGCEGAGDESDNKESGFEHSN